MIQLAVEDLKVSYHQVPALEDVSLDVREGEFFTIVGPTNAGKSTFLKTIAGLVKPDRGRVSLKGRNVTAAQPKDRNLSLLFQNIALFPNLTGFQNIAFPLRTAGLPDSEIETRVKRLAAMLKVDHVLGRYPRTFSGGEQQRVAIGRAIAMRCDLLMLDEPLTNLDARIRIALRVEFKKIHRQLEQTLLYVTHDQVEAMSLSDRIGVLHKGRFQQIGTPEEIYDRPATRFVGEFFGMPAMNIVNVNLADQGGTPGIEVAGQWMPLPEIKALRSYSRMPTDLALGIRSESIRVDVKRSDSTPHPGTVSWVERLGSHSILELQFAEHKVRVKVRPGDPAAGQSRVWFGLDARSDLLLDRDSGHFLR
jgi:multiple sugar transport system ATP-binding protein